ncbi:MULTISPECIES: hypothetical protein [Acidianus]|uniref:Uncharacterized protein n=1 Tax=Candidatus Acidianus copahuensis TaxID=1160895 RepID=A0A031LRM6_9CREN|nr:MULTISPECIES: hypothetical protein [Acidianus]EZQ07074.1 hypothetical protein CM19_06945 [Candidatus Acidianus copahuensis]NON62621.1 hypothetical protein [Acidianus sp. RZ1]
MIDSCGCNIKRVYASDFLMRRLFRQSKPPKDYKKLGDAEVQGRHFSIYYKPPLELAYTSNECPLVIITLEALCEAFKDRRLKTNNAVDLLKEIRGFQVNELSQQTAQELVKILEKSSLLS